MVITKSDKLKTAILYFSSLANSAKLVRLYHPLYLPDHLKNSPPGRAKKSSISQRENLFFLAMLGAMTFVVLVGFARTFFLSFLWSKPARTASSEFIFYFHGVVFASWMAFAIVQPILVMIGRFKWHRMLGWLGTALSFGVVFTGIQVAFRAAARQPGEIPPQLPLTLLGVIVLGLLNFSLLVLLAIMFRRDIQMHKRLMLLATINLLQAPISRIPLAAIHNANPMTTFLLAYLFIIPLVFWDLALLRRLHPATLWGGLGIVFSLPLHIWMANTAVWLTVAKFGVQIFK